MGDHATAMLIAGSVAMALLDRQRTGNGQTVDVSLHNTGLWVLASDVNAALVATSPTDLAEHRAQPTVEQLPDKDDRWIMLVMLVSDMYWPQFCRAIGREDSSRTRASRVRQPRENREELIAMLDDLFAQRTLDEWTPALDTYKLIWAPALTVREAVPTRRRGRGRIREDSASRSGRDRSRRHSREVRPGAGRRPRSAPELGQHTEEMLLDAGYDWDDIVKLRGNVAVHMSRPAWGGTLHPDESKHK